MNAALEPRQGIFRPGLLIIFNLDGAELLQLTYDADSRPSGYVLWAEVFRRLDAMGHCGPIAFDEATGDMFLLKGANGRRSARNRNAGKNKIWLTHVIRQIDAKRAKGRRLNKKSQMAVGDGSQTS